MGGSGGDLGHVGAKCRHLDGVLAHGRRAVAELALPVVAPAPEGAVGLARAAMPTSDHEVLDAGERRSAGQHDLGGFGGVGGRPIAELAVYVVPPAEDRPVAPA